MYSKSEDWFGSFASNVISCSKRFTKRLFANEMGIIKSGNWKRRRVVLVMVCHDMNDMH